MSAEPVDPFDRQQPLTKTTMGIEPGLGLEVAGSDPESLRRGIQLLMDIEAIKQLKHAYFRCIDTANLDELAEIFHPDVSVHFQGGNYEWKLEGREEYLASLGKAFTRQAIGHHNGHQPEIQVLSGSEATGLWYLSDNMWILNHKFFTGGTAIYWDRYVKDDGRWMIKETRYRRLYEISRLLEENPPLSAHYLGAHGAPVE